MRIKSQDEMRLNMKKDLQWREDEEDEGVRLNEDEDEVRMK